MTDEEYIKMLKAQAKGFRRITLMILTGMADLDPLKFVQEVKVISQQAVEEGA